MIFHFARCITLKVNLSFILHFFPRFSAFVDSYYSSCGPLGITPGRFCYRNAKFWAEFGYGDFGLSMGILARLCLPKYKPWFDQLNSPDMPPKRTKKVRFRYKYHGDFDRTKVP